MDEVEETGSKLASTLHHSGEQDMSVMSMQRFTGQYVYNYTLTNYTTLRVQYSAQCNLLKH
jgi:hypothetical protein